MRLLIPLIAAGLVLTSVDQAWADDEPRESPPTATASTPGSDDGEGLRWNPDWPRFRWWEYAGTATLLGGAFALRFGAEWDTEPNWSSGILADDWVVDHVVLDRNDAAYDPWRDVGDWAYRASLVWPALDPLITGIVHGNWDVAAQMTLMNLEAFAVLSSTLWVSQYLIRRERPDSGPCGDECESVDDVRSFIGGHTAVITTTAALTCLHHTEMEIYGEVGDGIACGAWVAAAGLTFTSRTVVGRHYLSDNVLGVGLGLASGWLVPWALHYAHGGASGEASIATAEDPVSIAGATVVPHARSQGAEVRLLGTLF